MKRHQPKHIYADNRIYFITSHIQDRDFIFDQDTKRDKFLLKILSFAWENEIELIAWSLLRNHYHLLLKISEGRTISKYISDVHRGFSFEMNQSEGVKVFVGLGVGVIVGVGVAVGVEVAVGIGVLVGLGVKVCVGKLVAVGSSVTEPHAVNEIARQTIITTRNS